MNCCVPGCHKAVGIHIDDFYRFPWHDRDLAKCWMHCIVPHVPNKQNWLTNLNQNTRVCSDHFKPQDFITYSGRRLLKDGAVPSILSRSDNSVKRMLNFRIGSVAACTPPKQTSSLNVTNSKQCSSRNHEVESYLVTSLPVSSSKSTALESEVPSIVMFSSTPETAIGSAIKENPRFPCNVEKDKQLTEGNRELQIQPDALQPNHSGNHASLNCKTQSIVPAALDLGISMGSAFKKEPLTPLSVVNRKQIFEENYLMQSCQGPYMPIQATSDTQLQSEVTVLEENYVLQSSAMASVLIEDTDSTKLQSEVTIPEESSVQQSCPVTSVLKTSNSSGLRSEVGKTILRVSAKRKIGVQIQSPTKKLADDRCTVVNSKMTGRLRSRKKKKKKKTKVTKDVKGDLVQCTGRIVSDVKKGKLKAKFLLDLLWSYSHKKPMWSESSIRFCVMLYLKSPGVYLYIRKCSLLSLPSLNVLKRYLSYITIENTMPSLVQQRISKEVRRCLRVKDKMASLIFEGAVITPSNNHRVACWMNGKSDSLPGSRLSYLLCFSLRELSVDYTIPIAYYLMREPSSTLMHTCLIQVLDCVEKLGVRILKIQGCVSSESCDTLRLLSGSTLLPKINHPKDALRSLFISCDPSKIIKGVMSSLLDEQQYMVNHGKTISAAPLMRLFADRSYKLSLLSRHFHCGDRGLKQVIKFFSKFSEEELMHASLFLNVCETQATVKFMKMMKKWFRIVRVLNKKPTSGSAKSSEHKCTWPLKDKSIMWLSTTFLEYFESWRKSCHNETQFLKQVLYKAIVLTTTAAVQYARYLSEDRLKGVLHYHMPKKNISQVMATVKMLPGKSAHGTDGTVVNSEPCLEMATDDDDDVIILGTSEQCQDIAIDDQDVILLDTTESDIIPQNRDGIEPSVEHPHSSSAVESIIKPNLNLELPAVSETLSADCSSSEDEIGSGGVECNTVAPPLRRTWRGFGSNNHIKEKPATAITTRVNIAIVQRYLAAINEHRSITDIPVYKLNKLLCDFIWNAKRRDGREFQPCTLRGILCSVSRRLVKRNYGYAIFSGGPNELFKDTRDALRQKTQQLLQARKSAKWTQFKKMMSQGKDVSCSQEKPLKDIEIEQLYTYGILSHSSAKALLTTVLFYNNELFGLSVTEHHLLQWGHVKLLKDSEGNERLECLVRSDTNVWEKEGLAEVCRIKKEIPQRDPVMAYKLYASQRTPLTLSPDSPFYLDITTLYPSSNLPWYSPIRMSRYKINKILKAVYQNASPARREATCSKATEWQEAGSSKGMPRVGDSPPPPEVTQENEIAISQEITQQNILCDNGLEEGDLQSSSQALVFLEGSSFRKQKGCITDKGSGANEQQSSQGSLMTLRMNAQRILRINVKSEKFCPNEDLPNLNQVLNSCTKSLSSASYSDGDSLIEKGNFLTKDQEDEMWSSKAFGDFSPEVLLRTLVYLNGKNFGLSSEQEHKNLKLRQLSFIISSGRLAVRFVGDDHSKEPCSLQSDPVREVILFVDDSCSERCHVLLLQKYLAFRPPNHPVFYLEPRHTVSDNLWFHSEALTNHTWHCIDKCIYS